MIEHILLAELKQHTESKLAKSQIGFVPGKETTLHIAQVLIHFMAIKDNSKNGFKSERARQTKHSLMFFDFSSAFDNIRYDLLLNKLQNQFQVPHKTIQFCKWYFN